MSPFSHCRTVLLRLSNIGMLVFSLYSSISRTNNESKKNAGNELVTAFETNCTQQLSYDFMEGLDGKNDSGSVLVSC